MKKIISLFLFAFISLSADHHIKRIVTFDTYNFKKTSTQCHIVGHGNYVNFEKKTVKREYSITTESTMCPSGKVKYTCHLTEITREVDNKLSRLEGNGACRPSIAPDPELLKAFCEKVPEGKDCK
jgi:hypothetical protein